MVRLRSPAPKKRLEAIVSGFLYGGFPERPKGADCKSVVTDFGGPNPPSPTKQKPLRKQWFFVWWRRVGRGRRCKNPATVPFFSLPAVLAPELARLPSPRGKGDREAVDEGHRPPFHSVPSCSLLSAGGFCPRAKRGCHLRPQAKDFIRFLLSQFRIPHSALMSHLTFSSAPLTTPPPYAIINPRRPTRHTRRQP